MKIKSAFKTEASQLSSWIISHFHEEYPQMTYLEPFCDDINIIISKEKSATEVVNNINSELLSIYQALRDEPKEFIRRLNLCKYCESTFEKAIVKATKKAFDDYLDEAVNEFVLRKMSRGSHKKIYSQTKDEKAWEKNIKICVDLSKRIHEMFILKKPANDVIQAFNSEDTFLYCKPPYLQESKAANNFYSSEMTTQDHIELSHLLNSFNGKAIISGCQSPLYNRLYKNWNIEKKKIVKDKTVEIIWKNF